jgi:sporulation integral membrane protein YtvI
VDSRLIKLLYIILALVALYYVLPYFVLFLLALVLAIIFDPLVDGIAGRFKVKRVIAVNINFFMFLLVTTGMLFLGSTKVISEILALTQQLPGFGSELTKGLQRLMAEGRILYENLPPEALNSVQAALANIAETGNRLVANLAQALLGTATAIPNLFVVVIVTLVSFYLFSLQLPQLKEQFLCLFTDRAREKVMIIMADINRAIIGFVRAQLIISGLTYLVVLAGLLILGVGYPLALALLIVAVDILPILGTGAVMVPWAVFLFILGNNFVATGLLVHYLVIIVFRRVVEPKILGQHIGLSALATVISMYVGFKILGMAGIAVGPAVCIIFNAMRKAGLFQQKIDF